MAKTSYPKRKHLTIIEKNGKDYFKVQYNKTKIGLVVNKTFSNYDDAIELLDACETKFGQSSVKGLIRVEENLQAKIDEWMRNPPVYEFFSRYTERYINPKYEHLNEADAKDKYKLRQKESTIGMIKSCLNTVISHDVENEWTLSKLLFAQQIKTKIADLRPEEVSVHDVNNLILALKSKGLTPISIATYLSRTSVFWRKIPALRKDNRPLENPWLHYDRDILTNGNKIFKKRAFRFDRATLKKVARTIQDKNIRPIVHLMYKLGLRRQEAVLLTKSQIFAHPTPHIYIQSKNAERIVYMNDRQYRFVKALIKPDQERLFDYKVMGFDGSYKKIFEDQNLEVKQHDFRKDYISRMIEQIGLSNSILLSQLLGFTTPRAIERLKNVYPETTGKLQNQNELLNQIGHSSSRITAEHYFSLK
jgi:integrase